MSRVFTGAGRMFQEVNALPLDEEGLRDTERRIKQQPHFLGEPLAVIGEAADLPQVAPVEPHDLLALDVHGHTVAISLTAEVADAEVATHALQLAAGAAGLRAEDLGKIAHSFIGRPANEPIRRAWEEMGVEISGESVELSSLLAAAFGRDAEDYAEAINERQRILIASGGFTSHLVNVIQFLNGAGVHIVGIRYRRYLVSGQEIFFAEQIVPTIDPAVDAPPESRLPQEPSEPWRIKGRAHYLERLNPAAGHVLNELLVTLQPQTFSITWSHKHYFWIRGTRRNLRVRVYHRDRIELGFYNAAPQAVEEFLRRHGIEGVEVETVGGYVDSPFVSLPQEFEITEPWRAALAEWLAGDSSAPPAVPRGDRGSA
jgi:hypothetical protein